MGNWYLRSGRIGRKTYALQYLLPLAAIGFVAAVLDISLGLAWQSTSLVSTGYSYEVSTTYHGGPISLITWLILLTPSISGMVARLHDRDHSGWWLLWAIVPIAGPVVLFAVLLFQRGDDGPNSYGDPEGYVLTYTGRPSWVAR